MIVRDADENLQIPLSKKMKVHLTQQMSDQVCPSSVFPLCLIETPQLVFNEIATFITDVLAKFQDVCCFESMRCLLMA